MPLAPTPLVVRIHDDRKAFYKAQATARGLTLSALVLKALDAFLEVTPAAVQAPARKLTDAEKDWFVRGAPYDAPTHHMDRRADVLLELLQYLPRTGTFNARSFKRDICETAGANMAQYRAVLMDAVRRGKLLPARGSLCFTVALPDDTDAPPPELNQLQQHIPTATTGQQPQQPQGATMEPDESPPDAGQEEWLR